MPAACLPVHCRSVQSWWPRAAATARGVMQMHMPTCWLVQGRRMVQCHAPYAVTLTTGATVVGILGRACCRQCCWRCVGCVAVSVCTGRCVVAVPYKYCLMAGAAWHCNWLEYGLVGHTLCACTKAERACVGAYCRASAICAAAPVHLLL
jgi:hypothetical protein